MASNKRSYSAVAQGDEEPPLKYMRPLLTGMKSYCSSGDFSDLIIKCQGREWKVHKAIICPQSDFFNKAVHNWNEGQEGVITLGKDEDPQVQDDPRIVDSFIHYMYKFDYNRDYSKKETQVAGIVLDARMYLMADKYLVESLKQLSVKKFKDHCEAQWKTSEFAEAAKVIYDAQLDRKNDLKQIVLTVIKAHAKELVLDSQQAQYSELQAVLGSTELGLDVLQALMSTGTFSPAGKTYRCPSCGIKFATEFQQTRKVTCPHGCYYNSGVTATWWDGHEV